MLRKRARLRDFYKRTLERDEFMPMTKSRVNRENHKYFITGEAFNGSR
jgi:hypothetical protein